MCVLSNTSLEVLEVSGEDAGEYVCMVDMMGETVSQTHLIIIAVRDNINSEQHALFFLQLLP